MEINRDTQMNASSNFLTSLQLYFKIYIILINIVIGNTTII